jgi:hypothetical protein
LIDFRHYGSNRHPKIECPDSSEIAAGANNGCNLGLARRGRIKNPPCQRVQEGSQKF